MENPKISSLTELTQPQPMQLNLGGLRKLLEKCQDLPDSTPLLYQRIEDTYFTEQGGWTVVMLPWESCPYHPEKDAERFADLVRNSPPGTYRIVERNGEQFLSERSQYIAASGAYRTQDDEGNPAVCLHAHY